MNSPLALLAVASSLPSGPVSGTYKADARGSRDSDDAPSFSDVMARQRAGQDAAAGATDAGKTTSKGAGGNKDEASTPGGADVNDDDKADADDASTAAPSLAQQALAIAAMASQLPGGPAVAGAQGAPVISSVLSGQTAGQASSAAAAGAISAQAGAVATTSAADAPAMPPDTSELAAGTMKASTRTDASASLAATTAAANLAGASVPTSESARASATSPDSATPATDAGGKGTLRGTADPSGAADAMTTDMRGRDAGLQPQDDARSQDDARRLTADAKAVAAGKDDATAVDATAPRNAAAHASADTAHALAAVWQAPVANGVSSMTASALRTPVGQPQWGVELGGQLVLMTHRAGNDTHTAELRLDPPDLGPLRVTIKMSDGIAEASFVSAHAAVRQAVESALPQLQQTLAQAGISLGHTNVSDQGAQAGFGGMPQGNERGGQQGHAQRAQGQADSAGDTVQIAVPKPRANAGRVDTFA